jgi:HNH endonuclease
MVTNFYSRCLLKVAHIHPFQMSSTERDRFWNILGIFWPTNDVAEWQRDVCTMAHLGIIENLLKLNTFAHEAWNNFLFALKPVNRHCREKLDVEIYWLRRSPTRPCTNISQSQFLTKPDFPANFLYGDQGLNLYHNGTGSTFRSGQIITLKPNLSESLPLSSFNICTMQWHLSRLAAMVGATNIFDDDDDDGGQ